MKKFLALFVGALLHVSVPAMAQEACNIEPMDNVPQVAQKEGWAWRPLTAAEVKLVVDGLPINNVAEDETFDSGVIVVDPNDGAGAIVLGRGGFSCGMVPLPPQGVQKAIKIIIGVGA
jgi:hypothetical protein